MSKLYLNIPFRLSLLILLILTSANGHTQCYTSIITINDTICIDESVNYVIVADSIAAFALSGDNLSEGIITHNGNTGTYVFYEAIEDTCNNEVDTIQHSFVLIDCFSDSCTLNTIDTVALLPDSICFNDSSYLLVENTDNTFAYVSGDGVVTDSTRIFFDPSLTNNGSANLYIHNVWECASFTQTSDSVLVQKNIYVCDSLPDTNCISLSDLLLSDHTTCSEDADEIQLVDLTNYSSVNVEGQGISIKDSFYVFNPQSLDTGQYQIIITNTDNCSNEALSITISLENCTKEEVLKEEIFVPGITPYPLPSDDNGYFSVYNYEGVLIRQIKIEKGEEIFWDGTDDQGRDVPLGAYIIHLKQDTGKDTHKIITIIR